MYKLYAAAENLCKFFLLTFSSFFIGKFNALFSFPCNFHKTIDAETIYPLYNTHELDIKLENWNTF